MVKVSVIIPTLNEAKLIGKVLASLKKQTFRDFEVIVVDGGSKDKTREIAGRYAKVIVDRRKGIGLGRNTGAKAAKGEILVFIDADTIPNENLISEYVRAFARDRNVVAATGPIRPLENVRKRVKLGYKIVSEWMVRYSIAIGKASIVGSNFAARKRVFDKIHGFDERLITYEDWDLSVRLQKRGEIKFVRKAVVHTSARRVLAWGMFGYFLFHAQNVLRYSTIKKPIDEYPEIR